MSRLNKGAGLDPTIRTRRENVVFENAFLKVYNNDVEFPSGETGTYVRTRWAAPHGVAALPVWDGKLLLMRNYRYSEGTMSVEIPQGFGTPGTAPQDDMQRELLEEIGSPADTLDPLGYVGHDYRAYLYLAHMPSGFAYNATGHEAGEAFAEPIIVDIPAQPEQLIEDLGIFDGLTQNLLMRLALRLRDEGFDAV